MFKILMYFVMLLIINLHITDVAATETKEVNFVPGGTGTTLLKSDEKCLSVFPIETYDKFPQIGLPHKSKGYFLNVTKSGCLLTVPLHFGPGAKFLMVYKVMKPGAELEINIGKKKIKAVTETFGSESSGWISGFWNVEGIQKDTQVKITFNQNGEDPHIIIDRFAVLSITPSEASNTTTLNPDLPSTFSTTTPVTATTLPTTKTNSQIIFIPVTNKLTRSANESTLSETTTTVKTTEKEAFRKMEAPVTFNLEPRKRIRERVRPIARDDSDDVEPLDPSTLSLKFWENVSVVSIVLSGLIIFALIGVTMYLINSNCM